MVNENMVTFRSLFKALLPLFLLLSGFAAEAAGPVTHFTGRYNFTWDGIALAAAELSIDEDEHSYALHLVLVSKGVVNLFTRHRSDTTVKGVRAGGRYLPRLYESRYWTKDKPRHIKLMYNSEGTITSEVVEPPEDRKERPEVPHAQKDSALDPLTVLLAMPGGDLNPHVFDAKRLWQGHAVRLPADVQPAVTITGRAVQGFVLSRMPLAGMTQKEMRDYNRGEPPVYLFVSADDAHLPVYMNMTVYLGRLQGLLTQECKTWDECKVN